MASTAKKYIYSSVVSDEMFIFVSCSRSIYWLDTLDEEMHAQRRKAGSFHKVLKFNEHKTHKKICNAQVGGLLKNRFPKSRSKERDRWE